MAHSCKAELSGPKAAGDNALSRVHTLAHINKNTETTSTPHTQGSICTTVCTGECGPELYVLSAQCIEFKSVIKQKCVLLAPRGFPDAPTRSCYVANNTHPPLSIVRVKAPVS